MIDNFLRFRDLQKRGIVPNRVTLHNRISAMAFRRGAGLVRIPAHGLKAKLLRGSRHVPLTASHGRHRAVRACDPWLTEMVAGGPLILIGAKPGVTSRRWSAV
jgi:hypothetical protein